MSTAINVNTQANAAHRDHEGKEEQGARRITREAGRALEILGHAIEYLTDEYMQEGNVLSATDPQVRAIRLLVELNREVYFECPVVPTLAERVRTFFGTGKSANGASSRKKGPAAAGV
ncbi:MAG: hypothetical protein JST28_06665 [Acidobacteria bacterium]|nr:hypothetical protein [Acidobacteriota bacterium]